MDASDVDDIVTHIDQLKSHDPKINKILQTMRNVLEKIKHSIKKQEKEKESNNPNLDSTQMV